MVMVRVRVSDTGACRNGECRVTVRVGIVSVGMVLIGIVRVGMVTCTRFQFQLSSSCIFRDIRGSQIYTWGPYAPCTPPSGEFFFTKSEYFTTFNCVFNFNILALVVSEILGWSQIYVRGPCAPRTPPSENFLYPRRLRYYV